jgi:sec-independent protein translocase protein TatC
VSTEQEHNESEMPFLDNLEELRWRIVKSLSALIVTFMASMLVCYNYDVIALLITPIKPFLDGQQLITTHPMEKFTILLQIAGGFGVVLASPVILYQVWAFLSPALMPKERRIIIPVLFGAAGLFLGGIATSVFVFVPVTMKLVEDIKTDAIRTMTSASEYFSFLFSISLAFGALFELPILILVLTALGLVTPALLSKYRRHAFVGGLILCEIITPGDAIISTLVLFVPVYGLYEISILVSWFIYRRRLKREAAGEAIGAGTPS